MSQINLETAEVNNRGDNEIFTVLNQADDWSNFDELYRATTTLHTMRYLLVNGVTALSNKSAAVASSIASQLQADGYSLIYDESNKLTQITAPPGIQPYPSTHDPFVVTSTNDVTNRDDDETAVTLREALSCDPDYHFYDAIIKRTMTMTLTSPLVIDKTSYITASTGKRGTIKGNIIVNSGNLKLQGITINGNITIAPESTLLYYCGINGDKITGSITGGTFHLRGTVTLNCSINGLDTFVWDVPKITLGNNANIDLTGTLVISTFGNPSFVPAVKKWDDEKIIIKKQGIDFSGISGVANSPIRNNKILQIGDIGVFSQNSSLWYGLFEITKKRVFEIKEDASNIIYSNVSNIEIDKETSSSSGHVSFEDAIDSGFTVLNFNKALDNSTQTFYNGIRAFADCTINGNGADSTIINGGEFYASAYSMDMKDIAFKGTLFGGRNTQKASGSANKTYMDIGTETEDSALSIENSILQEGSRIYGGGAVSIDDLTLTHRKISVALSDTFVGNGVSIYGAGIIKANAGKIQAASVNLDIDSSNTEGCSGNIYAGGYFAWRDGAICISGDVNTVVRNGHFNYTGNGPRTTKGNSAEQGASTLRIEDGIFEGPVYAGGFSMGGESVVNGSTNLEITGGVFTKEIYGGCGANKAKNGSFTIIDGSANTKITAGETAIQFDGCIFAGSYGAGTILGKDGIGTTLTFSGDGDSISWDASSRIYGCCQLSRALINGSKELIFDAFSNSKSFGTLDKNNNFDTVRALNGSNVVFNSRTSLSNVHNWNLEAGSTLTWTHRNPSTTDTNDLNGDSLDIVGLDDGMEDSTLLSGCSFLNWDNATVSFNGGQSCACANGIYTDGTFKLWLEGNEIKVGMLASA